MPPALSPWRGPLWLSSVGRWDAARELQTECPIALGRGSHIPGCPSRSPESVHVTQVHAFVVFTLPSIYLLQGSSCKPEEHTQCPRWPCFHLFAVQVRAPPWTGLGGRLAWPSFVCIVLLCMDDASATASSGPKRMLPPLGLVKRELDCYKKWFESHQPPYRVRRAPSHLRDVVHSQN